MGIINKKWLDGTYRNTRLEEGNEGKHDGNNQDFGDPTENDGTPKGFQFEYPTAHMVRVETNDDTTSGGSTVEFYHDKVNNISCRTVHCHNFATHDKGDGSTGYHIHICFFMGCPTPQYMQENRKNATVTYTAKEINDKLLPVETPPPTTKKTFKAVRSGKDKHNGTFYFDEKYYNDFKDKKQQYDAKDTTGANWKATTTWTEVYAPTGGSSSPAPTSFKATYLGNTLPEDTGKQFTFANEYKSAFGSVGVKQATSKDAKDSTGSTWKKGSTFRRDN